MTLTAGPTTLFVMPGIALRLDAALGERLALPVEVHVDGIAGAGRVGLRTGLDLSSAERSLGGWYAGVRVGSWMLAEPAGRTLTLEAGPVVGYRHVTARGLVLQAGTGLLPRLVLAGDHAWSGIVVPALELRAGGRIR